MCKVATDGKSLKFGLGEWLRFSMLMLVITGAGVGAMKYFIRMEIKNAILDHCVTQHSGVSNTTEGP